jgi:hypothetical protein
MGIYLSSSIPSALTGGASGILSIGKNYTIEPKSLTIMEI